VWRLVADRFLRNDDGRAIDLATGDEVWVVERRAPDVRAMRSWADGYASLMGCWHSRLLPVVDAVAVAPDRLLVAYPFVPERPPVGSADDVAFAVRSVATFLGARGLNAGAALAEGARWREGRVVIQPDWDAGDVGASGAVVAIGEAREEVQDEGRDEGRGEVSEEGRDAAWDEARGGVRESMRAMGSRRERRRAVGMWLRAPAALGAVVAGLESVKAGDVRPFFVAAARGVGFTTFLAAAAREVRRLGMVPVSVAAWRALPDLAARFAGRSVVLLAERVDRDVAHAGLVRCAVSELASSAAHLAGVVAWVEPGASCATLTLPALSPSELRERVWVSGRLAARPDRLLALARESGGLPGVFVSKLLGVTRLSREEALEEEGREGIDEAGRWGQAAERRSPWSQGVRVVKGPLASGRSEGGRGHIVALRSSSRVLTRGRGASGGRVVRGGLRVRGGELGARVEALVGRRRWSGASRALHRDIEAARRRGDDAGTGRAALAMGRVRLAMADVSSAGRWFTQAAERAIVARDDRSAMEAVAWLGLAVLEDADLPRAERLLRAALLVADYSGARDVAGPGAMVAGDGGPGRSRGDAAVASGAGGAADAELVAFRRWVWLGLSRCLFWQGRFREIEIPAAAVEDEETRASGDIGTERLAVRLHLARGELGQAAARLVTATRLVAEAQDEEMAGAVEGDAARLQLMIGDLDACDRYLRDGLARRCSRARMLRTYLVLYVRLTRGASAAQRRRAARLAVTLLKSSTPPLVRIRARYWIEARRVRRSRELTAYVSRYGVAALASGERLAGGDRMWEDLQALLHICHETADERQALARACAHVRERLGAARVAVFLNPDAAVRGDSSGEGATSEATGIEPASVASSGSSRIASSTLAQRVIATGIFSPVAAVDDGREAGAAVRYGGATLGAIVCRWNVDAHPDEPLVGAMLMAAGAAFAPLLRSLLDRDVGAAAGEAGVGTGAGAAARARASSGILGVSAAITELRHTVRRVASAPFLVLIEGESGSGKELVARALHFQGPRRHRRFAAINCAAVSDELFESEMFGHVRGSFTGAIAEREGLFEEADGGTLFLDEVGELSGRGQAKLLRVIQEGEVRRVGENLPRKVDVRVIAATNRSLKDEVQQGRFRADLLYRLDVIRIVIPPLRERPEDIPVLALAFWEEATGKTGSRATLAPETLAALARYDWPGNVRELHNAMMALAAQAPPRGRIRPARLPPAIVAGTAAVAIMGPVVSLARARRVFEERFVRAALLRAGGRSTRAARELGLTRHGLRKMMTRLGIEAEAAVDEGE
jgi:DNA-binding NtrC family response regulator